MRAVVLSFLAAVIWGLWWIPIRYLATLGLDGAWAGIVMNSGAALAGAGALVLSGRAFSLTPRAALGAAFVGVAVATYSTAVNFGDVVRLILLFYLAPAWSKLIEWAFLGQPWRWSVTLALAASLGGAFLVLGGRFDLGALRLGDVLALSSGLAWAVGASFIYVAGPSSAMSLTVVTGVFSVLAALPFALISEVPNPASLAPFVSGAGLGLLYVLPILLITLWSAQRLSPALLSFLLTAEILSGVISGALLLDEPFGWMQVAGTVLIVGAAASEVVVQMRGRARAA